MRCEIAAEMIRQQRYTFRALGVIALGLVVLAAMGAASVGTSPNPDTPVPGKIFAGGWQLGLVAIVGLALCNLAEAIVAAVLHREEPIQEEPPADAGRKPPVRP